MVLSYFIFRFKCWVGFRVFPLVLIKRDTITRILSGSGQHGVRGDPGRGQEAHDEDVCA